MDAQSPNPRNTHTDEADDPIQWLTCLPNPMLAESRAQEIKRRAHRILSAPIQTLPRRRDGKVLRAYLHIIEPTWVLGLSMAYAVWTFITVKNLLAG